MNKQTFTSLAIILQPILWWLLCQLLLAVFQQASFLYLLITCSVSCILSVILIAINYEEQNPNQ